MSQIELCHLYFVLPTESSTHNDCSDDMHTAYNCVLKYGSIAEFVKPSFCLQYQAQKNDVFVFQTFQGEAFDFLKQNSSKILGARCVITCVSGARKLPPGPNPVFTEAMRDLFISCTNFEDPAVKKKMIQKIVYMGGIYDGTLRAATTHLIIEKNILTKKAFEASKLGIAIMSLDWVDSVWEDSQISNIHAKDETYSKFKCPLFYNLVMTTSGINRKEKDHVKSIIEKHGGKWSGEMGQFDTHLVIIEKPLGEKYKFAKLWNVPCVRPQWLYDCNTKQCLLDFTNYLINESSKPRSSTPNKNETINTTANLSAISHIEGDLTHVNETAATDASVFPLPKPIKRNNDIINEISMENVKKAGQFLDGYNIFLYEFQPHHIDKLKKILNYGGATRLDEFSSSVTHIVAGKVDKYLQTYRKCGVVIVNVDWLVRSIELGKPAPEDLFLCFENNTENIEPPSPSSKQAAELLVKIPKAATKLNFDEIPQHNPAEEELLQNYNSEMAAEAFKQLDNLRIASSCTQVEQFRVPASISQKLQDSRKPEEAAKNHENISFSLSSTTVCLSTDFFKGLKFFISEDLNAEEKENIEISIVENKGEIVGKKFTGVADYAVVPIQGTTLKITAKEIINFYFIADCLATGSLVPLQYYHQPITIIQNLPLSGCVISVTNYSASERDFVETLIVTLGAVNQPSLARKSKDKIQKSTHLICNQASGPKYEGARRWGLPVVYHDWLLKCASLGVKVSEQPYVVTEMELSDSERKNDLKESTMSNKTTIPVSSQKGSTPTSNKGRMDFDNSFVTPKANVQTTPVSTTPTAVTSKTPIPAGPKTPLNNVVARLRQQETPNTSPDSNQTLTPTSPYGAFYGNDNPSPGTRKRLYKWMTQGIEFPQDPPMKRLETPEKSTPVSVYLKRQLEMMKRKPEDYPPNDSPVAYKKFNAENESSRLNFNEPESQSSDLIAAALVRMKELEDNYIKTNAKENSSLQSNECLPSSSLSSPVPPARNMVVYAESQPHTEVGWEDPADKEFTLQKLQKTAETTETEVKIKVYMLSGYPDNTDAKQIIEESGGRLSTAVGFDKSATHLITTNLTRAEKMMCSICAGIWILHGSYLDELRRVKSVYCVDEEDYEWGNPNKTIRLESLSKNARECAESAYYWRQHQKQNKPPIFKDLKVILHITENKHESFKKILEAGGGIVVEAKPPYNEVIDANLCICDPNLKEKINLESLAKQNINCVVMTYVSDVVFRKQQPIDYYFVPNFSKYKSQN